MLTNKNLPAQLDDLISKSHYHFIGAMSLLSIAVGVALTPVIMLLEMIDDGEDLQAKFGTDVIIFSALFIAPIVETFLFQHLLIRFLQRKNLSRISMVLISSAVFSLTHSVTLAFMYSAFVGGIVLAYTYLLAADRNFNAFRCTVAVHAFHNAVFVALALLFG